ncbi:PLD nuclease N-terminal domain-containing protein [Daejeonella sp.]|uniref:PLD nuclease N-terminal domain-containing protein n=1 Tax=Daejeonella sp. TaxID=2805397 RepID=UPI003C774343
MEKLLFLNLGQAELFLLMLVSLLAIVPLILTLYCIFDISRSKFNDPLNKVLWVLIVLFVPLIGSILYLVLGRSQKKSFESA